MVYEGVLRKISGGGVIRGVTGCYVTSNMGITREHKTGGDDQSGYIRREFVDIGGTRITGLVLMPYYDELLQEALGKEVALSCVGPHRGRTTVVAMRTPDGGLTKPSLAKLVGSAIPLVVRALIGAVLLGGLTVLVGGVAVALATGSDSAGASVGPVIGIVCGALLWGAVALRVVRALSARSALG